MKTFSVRVKKPYHSAYNELMFFSSSDEYEYYGSFTVKELIQLLLKTDIDITKDIYIKGEQLELMNNTIRAEIERLVIEKGKGSLIGQYPPYAIRNLNVEVLGKEYIFNIRNQWHQYIITLHELYVLFSKVAEEGGEVCFVHV